MTSVRAVVTGGPNFGALCDRRARRAAVLADRYPECAEPLRFYGAVAAFQKNATPRKLIDLVVAAGPELLRELAKELDDDACREAVRAYQTGEDRTSPRSFFGRVLLQAETPREDEATGNDSGCPRCGHPPQVGVLVPEGHGTALRLACSRCFAEWPHPRERCPGCGREDADLVYYEAPEIPHVRVQACESCRAYLHLVRLDLEPSAVPDVDEIAALPLDVWAGDKGYQKVIPNLIGI